jgi:hypothetical protein
MSEQTFRGAELSSLGVLGHPDPFGVGLSDNVNVFGSNHYSVGWCGSECHSF